MALPSKMTSGFGVIEYQKFQITNIKQITMTKIQNFKPVLVIEYWNLRFVCNLVLGVWDFIIPSLQLVEWWVKERPAQGQLKTRSSGPDFLLCWG